MQDVSEDFIRQSFAGEPEEPVLLATLTADGLEEPIRVTTHDGRLAGTTRRGLISRGETYDFVPFGFAWPGAAADEPVRDTQLEIFNRDASVTLAIRTAVGNPTLTVEMVRLDAPDAVENAITNADVAEVEIDDPKATATIRPKRFDTEPACKASYLPSRVPGLF